MTLEWRRGAADGDSVSDPVVEWSASISSLRKGEVEADLEQTRMPKKRRGARRCPRQTVSVVGGTANPPTA